MAMDDPAFPTASIEWLLRDPDGYYRHHFAAALGVVRASERNRLARLARRRWAWWR